MNLYLTVSIFFLFNLACKPRVNISNSNLQSAESSDGAEVESILNTKWQDFTQYRKDLGVSPDCMEKPITYSEFEGIAVAAKSAQDFLDRLNKLEDRDGQKIMQTFTLLKASESTQMNAVSPENPGVIRMTQDGKLIMRYVCDRSRDILYNHIEVIRYDDSEETFKFVDFDFSPGTNNIKEKRVHSDPGICVGCHNQSSKYHNPRPNWSMYPDWPVAFGSHDDFFPNGTSSDVNPKLVHMVDNWRPKNAAEEQKLYYDFLADKVKGKNSDPCYTSLPWPKQFYTNQPIDKLYTNFPYGTYNANATKRMYALRPNLKMSEIFSKLLARKNWKRLRENINYSNSVKGVLALEAARCHLTDSPGTKGNLTYDQLHSMAESVLGKSYKRPESSKARGVALRGTTYVHNDPQHESSSAQILYGVSRAFGFMLGDWTLTFGYPNRSEYEAGAGPGKNPDFPGDLPLTAYVQHGLLQDYIASNEELRKLAGLIGRATGESDDFGQQYACLDKLAGPTVFKKRNQTERFTFDENSAKEVCSTLVAFVKKDLANGMNLTAGNDIELIENSEELLDSEIIPFNKEQQDIKSYISELQKKYPLE